MNQTAVRKCFFRSSKTRHIFAFKWSCYQTLTDNQEDRNRSDRCVFLPSTCLSFTWTCRGKVISVLVTHTQNELCVGGVRLRLQCSYEDVDQAEPQRQEGHRLVVWTAVLLVKLSLQQNLKQEENKRLIYQTYHFLLWLKDNGHIQVKRKQPKWLYTSNSLHFDQSRNRQTSDLKVRGYLRLDVPKVMWERQHGQEDVDGGSPQVSRIYIHFEFGQFPEKCMRGGSQPWTPNPERNLRWTQRRTCLAR